MPTELASCLLGPAGGRLLATVQARDGRLERIRLIPATGEEVTETGRGVAAVAAAWLSAAQADPRLPPAALPLAPPRTAFQGRLRRRLQALPVGTQQTYRALARELGSAPRAVAMAARANPIPLLVPCHRLVAVNGPGGYAGATEGPLAVFKAWLLEREAALGVD